MSLLSAAATLIAMSKDRRFSILLRRALRLRCTLCGQGKLFAGWFKMHGECLHCGAKLEREPGFFLGSIYFNYGLTALIVGVTYPLLLFSRSVPERPLQIGKSTTNANVPIRSVPERENRAHIYLARSNGSRLHWGWIHERRNGWPNS